VINEDAIVQGTANEIALFLSRRLTKLRTQISGVLNINPFLMAALRDFHQFTDQTALAEFMLSWHLGTGHATSFGKMIDERLLPHVFGTTRLDTTCRHQEPYNRPPFDDIDHIIYRSDGAYLLSLKASSWTIQYGQAMGLYNNFRQLGEQHLEQRGIVVGVFYGHKGLLTDKYRIVRGENVRRQAVLQPLPYVTVKAGEQFWRWLNDDNPATQDWVMTGILQGADYFHTHNADVAAVVGGAAQQLVEELQRKYALAKDGTLDWYALLHAINNDRGERLGTEAVEIDADAFTEEE